MDSMFTMEAGEILLGVGLAEHWWWLFVIGAVTLLGGRWAEKRKDDQVP